MQLQPQLVNMSELLHGRLFRIPEYQRAYAWETKQRDDLFADIERLRGTEEEHFMAAVVGLAKKRKRIVADEFVIVEIVDGQQRLTTIVILLKAIQRALDSSDKTQNKLFAELTELLVKGDELNLLLLQTNQDSSELFADYIRDGVVPSADASTSADQNITDAIRESEEFVARWKQSGATVVELIGIIRNRLWTILYTVDDEAIVYRVFEVLNSRGLDVSWIDKLKSQLMGLAFEAGAAAGRDEAIKELHLTWQAIYRAIGLQKRLTVEAVQFAGTLKAEKAPSRPLSEAASVQRLLELAGTKSKSIVDCAKWLRLVVEAETELLSHPRWRGVTGILQARLVAIAVLLRKFSAADQKEILGRWERVSFRIFGLSGLDSRTKVGEYTRLAWSVTHEKLSPAAILQRLSEIGRSHSIDSVIGTFDPSNCYEGWTESLRYLLYRYDEHLAAEAGEKLNEQQWNKIWAADASKSIEHIQPQSSGVAYMHHLGNLTMLPPGLNSKLQDKPPRKKADSYRTSGLRQSIAVADQIAEANWSKGAVVNRAQKILTWAKREWGD